MGFRFEFFCPKLVPGNLRTGKDQVIYEREKSFAQVAFPVQLTQFLVLCDGQTPVRDIIDVIHERQGAVQFRSLFNATIELKNRGFLENGDELAHEQPDWEKKDFPLSNFPPQIFNFFLGQRFSLGAKFPLVFYLLALVMIGAAMIILPSFSFQVNFPSLFKSQDSYLSTLIYCFAGISLLMTLKGLGRSIMVLLLTGRIDNLSLVFNGVAIYLRPSVDSLFLVSNKLYLSLFYVASMAMPVVWAGCVHALYPKADSLPLFNLLTLSIIISDLNPFYLSSDLSRLFGVFHGGDNLKRVSTYLPKRSILSLVDPSESDRRRNWYYLFTWIVVIWGVVLVYFLGRLTLNQAPLMFYTIKNGPWLEKMAASILLLGLEVTCILAAFSLFRVFYIKASRPISNWVHTYHRYQKAKRVSDFSPEKLTEELEKLPLFSYFSEEHLAQIIERCVIKSFPTSTRIIVQGDRGRHLFVLLKGHLRVQKRDGTGVLRSVGEIWPTSIFGEVAVIEDCTRTAEVVAEETSMVMAVPATLMRELVKESRFIREINDFRKAIMVSQFFASAPLFRDLSEDTVHKFVTRGKLLECKTDQIVFSRGSGGDGFYLIVRGGVRVTVGGREINRINQGGFFGEVSVIADVPRTATISALEPTVLLKIGREAFWDILAENIEMAMFIETVGEMRIKEDLDFIHQARTKKSRVA